MGPESQAEWPLLPLARWQKTARTLQLMTQVVGKVRLALARPTNHWWHVPFYVTSRGLTTSLIPYGGISFEVLFDFLEHRLIATTSEGRMLSLGLGPRPVTAFYQDFMALLHALGIDVHIWTTPVEMPDPIPFEKDRIHASYDAEYVTAFHRALVSSDEVLKEFSGRFQGKQSPVHFFWGSFDLASTRFSGKRAPERPGADRITREAYSHEVVSFGFWPGTEGVCDASFYAYAAPEPAGFKEGAILPATAGYDPRLSEYLLPYEAVRSNQHPRQVLLDFFQGVYEHVASRGGWNRQELDVAR